jgi:hypothetical protein
LGPDPSTSLRVRRDFHVRINDLSASHLVLSAVEGDGSCSISILSQAPQDELDW